jgi:predicted DNA-binding protein (UPF0251 family)
VELREALVPASDRSTSTIGADGRRFFEAIDSLPEDEREVFSLVRIQGLTQQEAADVLGVSAKRVQRRLNRSLRLLKEQLAATPGQFLGRRGREGASRSGEGDTGGDPRVQYLLEEILNSDRSPEDVCRDSAELLPQVRQRLKELRLVEAQAEVLFPEAVSTSSGGAKPPVQTPAELP